MEDHPVISSTGLIVYRLVSDSNSIQYLLLRKRGEIWEPPKGRIDPGEQTFDAAMRETAEEANLTSEQLELDNNFAPILVNYKRENRKLKTAKFWLARVTDSSFVRISSEHEEFRWCSLDEVKQIIRFDMAEGFVRVHSYLLERASSNTNSTQS